MLFMSLLLFLCHIEFVLLNLILLEFIVVVILNMLFYILITWGRIYRFLFFLIIFILEGILGLVILVLIIRDLGNDNIKFLNLIIIK